jgi:hypothetical protein
LVDVGSPGERMPWIHSLGVEVRERKEVQERRGDIALQRAYRRRVTEARTQYTHLLRSISCSLACTARPSLTLVLVAWPACAVVQEAAAKSAEVLVFETAQEAADAKAAAVAERWPEREAAYSVLHEDDSVVSLNKRVASVRERDYCDAYYSAIVLHAL